MHKIYQCGRPQLLSHVVSRTQTIQSSFAPWKNWFLVMTIFTLIIMSSEILFGIVGMLSLPGTDMIRVARKMEQCYRLATQCSRNGEPSTQALMIAVANVQAVLPSNMKTIQNDPRIHRLDHLPGLHLPSFPCSAIYFQCHLVNGKLIVIGLQDRCLITSKLPQSHTPYWSSLQYRKTQYRCLKRF